MATNSTNAAQQETTPAILKDQRAREAAAAMREYQAERLAVLARSERLRALRLAKQVPSAPAKAPKARRKAVPRAEKRPTSP
jgi:hypothetical protein